MTGISSRLPYSTELGYAERTTSDTTTNTTLASAPSNKISGMSVTVIGTGQPVSVEFFCPYGFHSVADGNVTTTLVINGSATGAQFASTANHATNIGQLIVLKRRLVLTAGTSYTFEIGKSITGAGTGTWAASTDAPMHLAVTR